MFAASWYQAKFPESTISFLFRKEDTPTVPADLKGIVKVWNTQTLQERFALKGHEGEIDSAAFSPNGKLLATVTTQEIRIWNVESGTLQKVLSLNPADLAKDKQAPCFGPTIFSPDSKVIVSAGNGAISVWDVSTGTLSRLMRGHQYERCTGLAFTPDGKRLASAYGIEVKIWNIMNGQELLTLPAPDFGTRRVAPQTTELVTVLALSFTPDAKRLYAAVKDGTILYWDGSPKD